MQINYMVIVNGRVRVGTTEWQEAEDWIRSEYPNCIRHSAYVDDYGTIDYYCSEKGRSATISICNVPTILVGDSNDGKNHWLLWQKGQREDVASQ